MRTKGSTSSIAIPLSELTAKLGAFPQIKVKVSKGWLEATEQALGVSFTTESAEVPAETAAPANDAARPKITID
jgi:hypothetical protein